MLHTSSQSWLISTPRRRPATTHDALIPTQFGGADRRRRRDRQRIESAEKRKSCLFGARKPRRKKPPCPSPHLLLLFLGARSNSESNIVWPIRRQLTNTDVLITTGDPTMMTTKCVFHSDVEYKNNRHSWVNCTCFAFQFSRWLRRQMRYLLVVLLVSVQTTLQCTTIQSDWLDEWMS